MQALCARLYQPTGVVVSKKGLVLHAPQSAELGAVLALAPRDGALDLSIRPGADALLPMRRDVTRPAAEDYSFAGTVRR